MNRSLLALAIFGVATSSLAETLYLPSFRVEVTDHWAYSIQTSSHAHDGWGDLVVVEYPNGTGMLKLRAFAAPELVSQTVLRELTNVDFSQPLAWQNWGDYSGYQFDYQEKDSFYRQWWLAHESTIIFVTYDSSSEPRDIEIDEINEIVNSIAPPR